MMTSFDVTRDALKILAPQSDGQIPENWFNQVQNGRHRLNVVERSEINLWSYESDEYGIVLTAHDFEILSKDLDLECCNIHYIMIDPSDRICDLEGVCSIIAKPE